MSSEVPVETIFQGSKCFWRTRTTVDVTLVHHNDFNVLELITYEPFLDREAPRIYIDNTVLYSKIDQNEVEVKLKEAKELILRRHQVPNTEELLKEIINTAKISYILNRLFLAVYSPDQRIIEVELQFNFRDHDEAHSSGCDISLVTCPKPAGLKLFKSAHYHTLMGGLVDDIMDLLHEDRIGLKDLRHRASVYENNADMILSSKDRWRIPIVYVKVRNGTALSKVDRKIWNAITKDLTPELAKAAVGEAMKIPLSAADLAKIDEMNRLKMPFLCGDYSHSFANNSSSAIASHVSGANSSTSPRLKPPSSPARNSHRLSGNGFSSKSSIRSSIGSSFVALSSSMKRRMGLSPVHTIETDFSEDRGRVGDQADSMRRANARTPKSGKAVVTAAPAEFINPRGTNISITPKPRSYLIPSRPKKRAVIGAESQSPVNTNNNKNNTNGMNSVRNDNDDADNSYNGTKVVKNLNTIDSAGSVSRLKQAGAATANNASSTTGGFTVSLSAGLSTIVTSVKNTFSSKKKPSLDATQDRPNAEDDDFNAAAVSKPTIECSHRSGAEVLLKPITKAKSVRFIDVSSGETPEPSSPSPVPPTVRSSSWIMQQHGLSPKYAAGERKGKLSREPSATELYLQQQQQAQAGGEGGASKAMTPEQYRNIIMEQQSEHTARSFQQLSSSAFSNSNLQFSSEGTTTTSAEAGRNGGSAKSGIHRAKSPVEQFFSSMSPWGRSSKSNKISPIS